jgi:hypothetical protein
MCRLGNALVWIGLTVGLPSVLYAMTAASGIVEPTTTQVRHPKPCAICRYYRESKVVPRMIEDEDLITLSPGHPYGAIETEDGAGRPEWSAAGS